MTISIVLNGEPRELDREMTVGELLARIEVRPGPLAVEVNRAVVPRGRHEETVIRDGDRVEVVSFVGGG